MTTLPPLTIKDRVALRAAKPIGDIELGRRMGSQDPRAAMRARFHPIPRPRTYIRVHMTDTYQPVAFVHVAGESGHVLAQVVGAYTANGYRASEDLPGMHL